MSKEDFYSLTPDQVLDGVESAGYVTTGQLIQLNSYENRVFEVSLENEIPNSGRKIITKFYRPGRWDYDTIMEEHEFLADLANSDIPAVAPLRHKDGKTLHGFNNMWMAVFPKARGRLVQELTRPELKRLGRTIARIHNSGATKKFKHRQTLAPKKSIQETLKLIQPWLPMDLAKPYAAAAEKISHFLERKINPDRYVRIHGDCHKGNILETDPVNGIKEYFLIDFDDSIAGPVSQDFWMLFSGDEIESEPELESLLAGYLELRDLNEDDLAILPGLRGLRILNYAGWIARRWEDPTFPKLFPQFTEHDYWREELQTLNEIGDSLS